MTDKFVAVLMGSDSDLPVMAEAAKVLTKLNIGHEVVDCGAGNVIQGLVGVRKGPADKYARRLELGFAGLDKLGRIYNQAPRPYLRAALQQTRGRLAKILRGPNS